MSGQTIRSGRGRVFIMRRHSEETFVGELELYPSGMLHGRNLQLQVRPDDLRPVGDRSWRRFDEIQWDQESPS